MPQVHKIIASAEQEGQRLDNFLLARIKGVPKSHIYSIIRRGEVRVNSKRIKPSYRIHDADLVRIPPMRRSIPDTSSPPPKLCELLANAVIYEDEDIIVLNKPPHIAVHGGIRQRHGIIESLRYVRNQPELDIAHRLDKETTGCLLISRRLPVLRRIHEYWHHEDCRKVYRLLVQGKWPHKKKLIQNKIRKVRKSGEYIMEGKEGEKGKHAATLFSLVEYENGVSLLEAELITGRTHQIRQQCSELGYPIIGDQKYAYGGQQSFRKSVPLALHAYQLILPAALGIARRQFTAPSPQNFYDYDKR